MSISSSRLATSIRSLLLLGLACFGAACSSRDGGGGTAALDPKAAAHGTLFGQPFTPSSTVTVLRGGAAYVTFYDHVVTCEQVRAHPDDLPTGRWVTVVVPWTVGQFDLGQNDDGVRFGKDKATVNSDHGTFTLLEASPTGASGKLQLDAHGPTEDNVLVGTADLVPCR